MISNCGSDERGKYSGGKAGDQTGGEWCVRLWYNRPWSCVLRHPDEKVRDTLARLARAAAENNLIGYDQNQRLTYWEHLKASGYNPAKITIACEADCSSGVAANVKAAGYLLDRKELQSVTIYMYTGNERAALSAAGFQVITDRKYLTSDDYLIPGDILLYDGHHTATNLDYGKEAQPVKYDYENLGWNKDGNGWWYATGHNRGQFHQNNFVRIDGQMAAFDCDGYLVNPNKCEMDEKGYVKYIHGDRVK